MGLSIFTAIKIMKIFYVIIKLLHDISDNEGSQN